MACYRIVLNVIALTECTEAPVCVFLGLCLGIIAGVWTACQLLVVAALRASKSATHVGSRLAGGVYAIIFR